MNRPFFAITLAGTPIVGYQDGALCRAQFSRPYGVCRFQNSLLVVDRSQPTCVRRVSAAGVSSVKWANRSQELLHPTGVAALNGVIFVADRGHGKIRYIRPQGGELRTLQLANVRSPSQIAVFGDELLVLDQNSLYCVELDFSAEGVTAQGCRRITANLTYPEGLAVHSGSVFVANTGKHQILRIGMEENSDIELFAGSTPGFEDGPAEQAKFRYPAQICAAGDSIFVSDRDNQTIRQIRGGIVTSLSQGTARGYQNGAYDVCKFNEPAGIAAFYKNGVFYLLVCDCKNACIRCLSNGRFAGVDANECLKDIFAEEPAEEPEEELFFEEEELSDENTATSGIENSTHNTSGQEEIEMRERSRISRSQRSYRASGVKNSALAIHEVVSQAKGSINDELPPKHVEERAASLAELSEKIKREKCLPISPHDALCEVCKVRGFDMVKLHVLLQNTSTQDTQPITEFINAAGPEFILPLCFGYANYFRHVVLAITQKVELDQNLRALLVLRNFLMWNLSIYRPHLFKRQIRSPMEHSELLARLSSKQICIKLRTSCGGSFLRVTRSGEFRCTDAEGPALFTFEVQVVICLDLRDFDGSYSQFECESECIPEESLGKQMYFRLVCQDGFLHGNGKLSMRVDDCGRVLAARIPFILRLRCLDYYREIPVKIGRDAPGRINEDLPRVIQLQEMYCISAIE